MSAIKRDWDVLSDEERHFVIAELVGHFEKERGEKIGVVAAGQILDLILKLTHVASYNRAVDDVKAFLGDRFEQSMIDIDASLRKG